ncbi:MULTISPECIES: MbcA/ParS/Xre antitoxin family protein [unclassified Legionella]|uniref:MbcA/ParS/Xre antitoxin family protein n=1 Tax=unclassified Legionella TaxID=2622702 RepID=UPI0010550D9F|nr:MULTISPECIES: MbcA/ParS/Xre antitoxin family protein [unclassified Legionella]MDI9817673.1 MbcA/ParS/Xre antitoxin family protein [Legionella sp. PL877]
MKLVANTIPPIDNEVVWKSLAMLVKRFDFKEKEALILMGDMPRSTYTTGIKNKSINLDRDKKERVSYLLGIYKALRLLFDDSSQALSWINRENSLPPFNGKTPKEYMLEGSIVRLAEVRKFLDYWRGY